MADAVLMYGSIGGLESVGVNGAALRQFNPQQKTDALLNTSRRMDGYFRKQFPGMPFIQVGADVHRCSNILTAYDLLSGRGFNPDSGGSDENLVKRVEAEMRWLERVASGLVTPDVTVAGSAEGVPSARSPMVVSSSSTSRGYSVPAGSCRGPFQGRSGG